MPNCCNAGWQSAQSTNRFLGRAPHLPGAAVEAHVHAPVAAVQGVRLWGRVGPGAQAADPAPLLALTVVRQVCRTEVEGRDALSYAPHPTNDGCSCELQT